MVQFIQSVRALPETGLAEVAVLKISISNFLNRTDITGSSVQAGFIKVEQSLRLYPLAMDCISSLRYSNKISDKIQRMVELVEELVVKDLIYSDPLENIAALKKIFDAMQNKNAVLGKADSIFDQLFPPKSPAYETLLQCIKQR